MGVIWDELKEKAPQCLASLLEQSQDVQAKAIELIARHANLVSREDFDRQKKLCDRLQQRVLELEQKIDSLKNSSNTAVP